MKTNFSGNCARVVFFPLWFPTLLGIILSPLSARAVDDLYINNDALTFPPQIDARNFVNYGSFRFTTTDPFETSDTLNYTNYGSLVVAPGWYFDNAAPVTGVRTMSDSFINYVPGVIEARDASSFSIAIVSPVAPSQLWVHATNIVNQGLLRVGANGWLKLAGTNVNVGRSGLEVVDISESGQGSFNIDTNFFPDVGISDLWWGQTNLNFASGTIWNGNIASAPRHPVQEVLGGGSVAFSFPVSVADSYSNSFGLMISVTNIVGIPNPGAVLTNIDQTNILIRDIYFPTNIYKQAVLVGISDPQNMTVGVTYSPSTVITNPFKTVAVEITFLSTNVITQTLQPTTLFFYDTLASETNRGNNINLYDPLSFRPANYVLSRIDDGTFRGGITGTGIPDPTFLFDPATYSNNVVAGEYSGYGAFVDDLVSEAAPVAGGTVTNLPGRVQIFADNLDMRNTRIRGGGHVMVNAKHLIGSSGAAVDCQNLVYNLASTNGNLRVVNLAKDSVERLKGDIIAWSGLWSNTLAEIYYDNYQILTNYDTNGNFVSYSATNSPLTNGASVNLHALLLDGDQLATQIPVITWDIDTRSTNVVIDDNMTVVESFFVDGQSFTLNGNVTFSTATLQTSIGTFFSSSISDWIYTNAPTLAFFTNNGTLTLPGVGHFGDDRPTPYSTFVNNGTVNATAIYFKADYFQNSGSLSAGGPLNMAGISGKLVNGQSSGGTTVNISTTDLKLDHYQLNAGGFLRVSTPGALLDAGAGSANQITAQSGLSLSIKPALGDLLGTTLRIQPPNFLEADHTWAGQDRGVSADGYNNNVALGSLVLAPQSIDSLHAPLIRFIGAGAQNGLYVDTLDLSGMGTNWNLITQQMLEIDPNIVIYYAGAKLGFTPPVNSASVPVEPEEFLDGQLSGHLRWVSSFAGPNSSVDVISNGVTIVVNKALRFSKIIDSNGDGVPNFFDANPFNIVPPMLTAGVVPASQPASRSVSVSWNALPNTLYHVEYSPSLQGGTWQPLTDYTSSSQLTQRVTIWDTNAPVNVQRFYRVRYTP